MAAQLCYSGRSSARLKGALPNLQPHCTCSSNPGPPTTWYRSLPLHARHLWLLICSVNHQYRCYTISGLLKFERRSMDIQSILADLKRERENLDRAIGALEGLGTRRRGRPAGSHQAAATPKRKRRHMSAASRKRISEMMK